MRTAWREHRVLAAKAPEHFWRRWLEQMGQDDRNWQPVTRFETTQLTYEAAASGLGLTLAIPLISERFAREQRLVPTLGPAMPIGIDYTVFYATADIARRAPIRAFVRWLHDTIAVSSADFGQWIDVAACGNRTVQPAPSLQH